MPFNRGSSCPKDFFTDMRKMDHLNIDIPLGNSHGANDHHVQNCQADFNHVLLEPVHTACPWQHRLAAGLRIRNENIRFLLAEFLGTFMLVTVGCASIAQAVLSKGADGNIVTIVFGWGLGLALGVYISGGVSGGHINPAVSTAMVLLGRLPLRKLPFYLIGQYTGALVGSLAVFVIYLDGLKHYDGGNRQSPWGAERPPNETGTIWGTYPKPYVSTEEGLLDQVFVTGLLVLIAMAITDERNMATPKGMLPLVIGFGLTGLLCGFVFNCSAALNPARDLAPRIFMAMAGWGSKPFAFRSGNWFWVPIIGPHIGAVFGALFYNICVGLHWPERKSGKYAA